MENQNQKPAQVRAFMILSGMMNSQVVAALIKTNILESLASLFYDLHMQVMLGGSERTDEEFRALFLSAGLKLNRIIPTKSPMKIIEACI
jgi:hypothetical protein